MMISTQHIFKRISTLLVLATLGCGCSLSIFAENISGTVLLPDGQPAAGAQVALAVPGGSLTLLRAKMRRHDGNRSLLATASADGHFSFPTNENDWAIVAMNKAGCTQIERKNFENGAKIKLQPWARIEGVFRIGTGVGTNQQVLLGSLPGARFFFELNAFQDWTDSNGKFTFAYVPAGTWNVSCRGEPPWLGEKVFVKAGETNRITIGGTGRPVIGKLLIPSAVTTPPNRASLPPGRRYVSFSDSESATNRTTHHNMSVTLYSTNHSYTAQMSTDGSFRVEDVTPGTWWLLAHVLSFPPQGGGAKTMAAGGRKVIVPEMSGGRSDEPLDLGTVEPVRVRPPQTGEAAPLFEVTTTDGGTFQLSGHRGKYVLLDFEPAHRRGQTNRFLQATWDAFGNDNRLSMLTLSVPPLHSGYLVYKPASSWLQADLRSLSWYQSKPLLASYGLQCDRTFEADTNLPAILLVGPDGTIVARDLHGDAVKAAVAKVLEQR
jgi:hypothetical protein